MQKQDFKTLRGLLVMFQDTVTLSMPDVGRVKVRVNMDSLYLMMGKPEFELTWTHCT